LASPLLLKLKVAEKMPIFGKMYQKKKIMKSVLVFIEDKQTGFIHTVEISSFLVIPVRIWSKMKKKQKL
jgi:hypothetical protein